MLPSMFNIGLNAVRSHRSRLETASHNLANVDTPGYSRQSVRLFAESHRSAFSQQGTGVMADAARRQVDEPLTRRIRDLAARKGFTTGNSELLAQAESIVGGEEASRILFELDSFFSAVSEASVRPTSIAHRQQLIKASDHLASTIRRAHADLGQLRQSADLRIESEVDEVNQLAQEVASLNKQILTSRNAPDLEDQRDLAIQRISELIDVDVLPTEEGALTLHLQDGTQLVGLDSAEQLGVDTDPTTGRTRVTVVGRIGPDALQSSELGGVIGGVISARDGAIATQQSVLDDMAFDLGNAVNAALAGGTDLTGTTPGAPLFDVNATRAGAAATFRITAAIENAPRSLALGQGGAPGDNRVALQIVALKDATFVGTGNHRPRDALIEGLSLIANTAQDANGDARDAKLQHDSAAALRASLLGVSTDEELVELTSAQRAFQGAARVIQTADEMAQEILSLKR